MPPAQNLARRLNTLRRYARLWLGTRATMMGVAASLGGFAAAALLLDKAADPAPLWIAWSFIVSCGLGALWWGSRPMRDLGGARVARLLRRIEPNLALRIRSAAELSETPGASSQSLVHAYVQNAWSELSAVRVRDALPRESLWRRDWLACLTVGLLGVVLLTGTGRGLRGTFTLLHPGARASDGTAVGVVFDQVTVVLAYPHYMQRPSRSAQAGEPLQLPPGTSVSVTALIGDEMRHARMHTPSGMLPLRSTAPGHFEGRFIVHGSGTLSLRASADGARWLQDARATRLEVTPDRSPEVSLTIPGAEGDVSADRIELQLEAEDDWGLARVEAIAQAPGGDSLRQVVWRESSLGSTPTRRTRAEHTLDLRALGLQPGDHFQIWLEAWDRDDVSGPHRGRSETHELSVESPHSLREHAIASLVALRIGLTHHLAGRLVPPDGASQGEGLERIARSLASAEPPEGVGASVLESLANHLEMLGRSESAARGAQARQRAMARSTAGVEDGLLSLDDLITSARIQDAADLARELASLRVELARLVAEMRQHPSPDTRRALGAAAARAQTLLTELSARLAEGSGPGSGEFLNPSAERATASRDAMAELLSALEADDMDAAERSIFLLETQLEALARGLGRADTAFAASQFGPRQAALAEAMSRLTDIETEQRSLATAAERVRFGAAERALSEPEGERTRPALRAAARTARAALDAIERRGMTPSDLRRLERSRAQLRDTQDALSAGDLARAREQARATAASVEGLARDLELAELIGAGSDPALAPARALRGREAEVHMRGLTTAIDRAIPDLRRHLNDRSRAELSAAGTRQLRAREAARELAARFSESPDGRPLSADAVAELGGAIEQMREAERAFARPDPVAAGDRSAEAARTLSRLRRQLQQAQRRADQGGRRRGAEHVTIHGREDAAGPSARRQRAMGALRRSPPPGYEGAVRRYYEELLR